MRDDVADYVRSCPASQRNKPTPPLPVALHALLVANCPLESTPLDWLRDFAENMNKNDSVLNVVCRFCKWVIVVLSRKNMDTEKICQVMWKHVSCGLVCH
jgi:hypothetical protein